MTRGRSGLGLAHLGVEPEPTKPKRGPCATRGCKTKHAPVRVSPDERYCEKHATKVADALCRAFVRARDPVCVACGRGDRGVQWAHIITRGARFIRWDARNGVGLCSGCHYAYTKSPARWLSFVERYDPGRVQRLLRREVWGERRGGSVDVAGIIRTYREGSAWEAEDPPDHLFLATESHGEPVSRLPGLPVPGTLDSA